MNETRLFERLARPGAMLVPAPAGAGYALRPSADRRRRLQGRIAAERVEAMAADGALQAREGGAFVLSAAGLARARRSVAAPGEAWRAQHDEVIERPTMDRDGDVVAARGVSAGGAMARLARIRNADGSRFFDAAEIAAGARLAQDWAAGQEGLLRGADWSAPPRGSAPRSAGGGVECARAAAIDARARVDAALAALAPATAALVRAACLDQAGLELIERRAQWPARSAKVALKFALGQLAHGYRAGARRP